jgi:hypothetical protein
MEWLLGDEDVWSPVLQYQLKSAIIFYRWITLKHLQGFRKAVFIGVPMKWLLEDEDV